MLASLALSAALIANPATSFHYDMHTFDIQADYVECAITTTPTGADSMGWIMAYHDGENFMQIGWWNTTEGVIPFWENWESTIYPYFGSSVDIPQGSLVNVAIANEPNSTIWDMFVQEGTAWAKVYSVDSGYSSSSVTWKLSTESHDATPVPDLQAGCGWGSGVFTPWRMSQ